MHPKLKAQILQYSEFHDNLCAFKFRQFVDFEFLSEIGSFGNQGIDSRWFENILQRQVV